MVVSLKRKGLQKKIRTTDPSFELINTCNRPNKSKIMNNISERIPKTGMIETKKYRTIICDVELESTHTYLQFEDLLNVWRIINY